MKRTNKFIVLFLIVAIIFSAVSGIVTKLSLDNVRAISNDKMISIIAVVREKYPDITDSEIANILNSDEKSPDTESILKKYGIDKNENWLSQSDEGAVRIVIVLSCAVCFSACICLLIVFIINNLKRKKELQCITEYINQINKRNYDLQIEENSEDETSLLKNEIYKTTVMLKEQSENSLRDKQNLKESLSDISHQLKTPLTSIIVMIDNILDNEDMPDDLKREFLSDIRHSANNISFLVQSLLTLSKLDANTIVLKSNQEDVSKIFAECIRNTSILAEIRSVNLTSNCENDLTLVCDFKWLCEAITNIVKNCIEHTNPNGTVKLSAEQNKMYTKITISDNGTGIDSNDLPHIFERFYKGKNADSNSIGIGLALAKTIIEKSGGLISVSSSCQKGTTFTIKYFHNKF